jgi:hypothetical protein
MSPGGRSLSTALALVAVAGLATVLTSGPVRESPRLPVASSAAARPRVQPAPRGAGDILAHAAALGLTPEQRARLETLDRQWRPRERDLLNAAADAQREMAAVTAAGRAVDLREIQQRATGFSELSAELRAARTRHADDAARVLTETQARQLREVNTLTPPGGGPK